MGRQRLSRVAVTIATGTSLALAIVFLGLWGRERYESDTWGWQRSYVGSEPGRPLERDSLALYSGADGMRVVLARIKARLDDEPGYGYWFRLAKSTHDGLSWGAEGPAPFEPCRWHMFYFGSQRHDVAPTTCQRLGLHLERSTAPTPVGENTVWSVGLPAWLAAAVLGLPPLGWEIGRRRRLRWARCGKCINCGYDLRSSQGRCPECGQNARLPVVPHPHRIRRL